MKPYNATITANVERLNFPLATMFARQYAAFRVLITNVPCDLSGVFLRLFNVGGTAFQDFAAVMVPANERPDSWRVTIPATTLADYGRRTFEVHAELEDGDKTAIGRGHCVVFPFSQGGAAPEPGTPISVAKMPTRDGGFVNCWATMDGTGEYTYEFEKVADDSEVTA